MCDLGQQLLVSFDTACRKTPNLICLYCFVLTLHGCFRKVSLFLRAIILFACSIREPLALSTLVTASELMQGWQAKFVWAVSSTHYLLVKREELRDARQLTSESLHERVSSTLISFIRITNMSELRSSENLVNGSCLFKSHLYRFF